MATTQLISAYVPPAGMKSRFRSVAEQQQISESARLTDTRLKAELSEGFLRFRAISLELRVR
jgi:hypothetical protein